SQVANNFSNFNIQNATDLELAGINSDKAFGALLKYNGKLNEKTDAYIQYALSYMISMEQCWYQPFTGAKIQLVPSPVSDALANTIAGLFSKIGTFAFFDTKEQ
ncbi:33407_t:CDS:2, partial [Gigaspora margarita]